MTTPGMVINRLKMNLFYLICLALILISFAYGYYIFVLARFIHNGPPYLAMSPEKVKDVIDLLEIKPGDRAVDLGSGDGRIVIAMACAGANATATGFEINPYLVWKSRRNIQDINLQNRASIIKKSFWHEDLSKYNKVSLFWVSFAMESLAEKLKKELKHGSLMTTLAFKIPGWKPIKIKDNIYLYEIK